jgi:hypothetical protein
MTFLSNHMGCDSCEKGGFGDGHGGDVVAQTYLIYMDGIHLLKTSFINVVILLVIFQFESPSKELLSNICAIFQECLLC